MFRVSCFGWGRFGLGVARTNRGRGAFKLPSFSGPCRFGGENVGGLILFWAWLGELLASLWYGHAIRCPCFAYGSVDYNILEGR
jgi:hypothetical protein